MECNNILRYECTECGKMHVCDRLSLKVYTNSDIEKISLEQTGLDICFYLVPRTKSERAYFNMQKPELMQLRNYIDAWLKENANK